MRPSLPWVIASKDLKIFTKKRGVFYSIVALQIFVSVVLPLVIRFVVGKPEAAAAVPGLIDAFSFWFVIESCLVPTGIASYSIVGEKIQKSLEPLLATPTTDEEILAGKGIAAFIPSIISTFIGAVVFIVLIDAFTIELLGYLYLPNWNIAMVLLVLAPLACIFSIGINVLTSSRTSDVRTAQQLGLLTLLPFAGIYLMSELGLVSLASTNLLVMSGALFLVDIAVFLLARSTFQREVILTKWR
jgi:ABC-2 type transport system permease protein